MELPKNITQIGESDHSCKVYVEDYVISFLKQWNQVAMDKDMAVALYGTRKEEGDLTYLFLYGACKLDFLQRETRHLSQAQQQEIERLRRKYFSEYEFQGYRLLNGEMIEGFHICEQGICRYIAGYAQFYEKNDSMLAYMLDVRGHEVQPETVDQEKYETVKRRQEARKAQSEEGKNRGSEKEGFRREKKVYEKGMHGRRAEERAQETERIEENGTEAEERSARGKGAEEKSVWGKGAEERSIQGRGAAERRIQTRRSRDRRLEEGLSPEEREDLKAVWKQRPRTVQPQSAGLHKMKAAAVAVFALLCLAGYATISNNGMADDLQAAARQMMAGIAEQKLPDAQSQAAVEAMSSQTNSNTLIADDALAEALQKENQQTEQTQPADNTAPSGTEGTQSPDNAASSGTEGTQSTDNGETPAGAEGSSGQASGLNQASETNAAGAQTPGDETQEGQVPSAGTSSIQEANAGTENTHTPETEVDPVPADAPAEAKNQTISYTIKQGDTLIAISWRNYGSGERVSEICDLNEISDPDDIKVGQKILLPQ